MNTKKIVFFAELGAIVVFILTGFISDEVCFNSNEYGHTTDYCGIFAFSIILPIISLLPFSILLYFFRDEVFRAWWRFARWFVPVIIVVTFLLNNASGGGGLGMDKSFTAFILIILYSILVITSLVKIFNAYFRTKGK